MSRQQFSMELEMKMDLITYRYIPICNIWGNEVKIDTKIEIRSAA